MKPNRFELTLLAGLARTIDKWKSVPLPAMNEPEQRRFTRVMQELASDECAVLDIPAFLGREPTASERVSACRAFQKLEQAGLIERLAYEWSNKTAELLLTPAGRALVDSIAAATAA